MSTDTHRRALPRGRGALLAGVVALALPAIAACAGSDASALPPPPPTPATTSATPTPTPPPVPPLARELVGRWETQHWLDPTGASAIVRTYRFAADGRYDYTIAVCRTSTDCTVKSTESGYAQAARGMLTLRPQTQPSDGARAYPYTVGRDPDVGDLQLHLTLTNGQLDIFYAG